MKSGSHACIQIQIRFSKGETGKDRSRKESGGNSRFYFIDLPSEPASAMLNPRGSQQKALLSCLPLTTEKTLSLSYSLILQKKILGFKVGLNEDFAFAA